MKKIFISKDILRKFKLIKKNKKKFLQFYNKSNIILIYFLNMILHIYNGNKFNLFKINQLKINYKLGLIFTNF